MKSGRIKRWMASLLGIMLLLNQMAIVPSAAENVQQTKIVLTLGADLSADQRNYVLQYFGVSDGQVETITITNADERSQLGNLISEEAIGTRTLSCALVKPTAKGGIQVKTANMNYVTSNMIASTLSTSGVYNCEVLTAAPFEVSGTGALTGVMMAYETAIGITLDQEKKELANEELVITGEIATTIGQEQATLVVNDIKIHIVRDQISDQQEVKTVVDNVIATTEAAAAVAAESQGQQAPKSLGQVEREKLYNFGYKFSQMGYKYSDMQETLERVTHNVTKSTGIDDPIVDTFTTINQDTALSVDSILLNTDDAVLGDDAIINATHSVAVGDHPAEPIEVFTGDVVLTSAGGIKAEKFIEHTSVIAYRAVNGSYALMDLNGNVLTEPIFMSNLYGREGYIEAVLDDGTYMCGVLAQDGTAVVPFKYISTEIISDMWAAAITGTPSTEEDCDVAAMGGYYTVSAVDVYYLGGDGSLVGTLSWEQFSDARANGDYLNIKDENGVVTTYDTSFAALRNADNIQDFGVYDLDVILGEELSERSGYSLYPFRGNYAECRSYDTDKHGVMDRYGNEIIPAEFDYIEDYNSNGKMMGGGYFAGMKGEQYVFITAGGTITGSFDYPRENIHNYGMAAIYKAEDGRTVLLSGDGKETDLGTSYSRVDVITGSDGMLWKGKTDNGYDLLDWHGNVLVSGCAEYSLAANGNYLIAQDGYTSSTLYLVNDASPVSISESLGGAQELEVVIEEAASMEVYTGDPKLQLVGEVLGTEFIDGTHLILASNDRTNYALMDLSGKQLTNPEYRNYFTYKDGWLISRKEHEGGELFGLIRADGIEVIPCQYDDMEILSENWAVGYTLTATATEEDHDYSDWNDNYYYIDKVVIYHMGETELSSVTLTRDQVLDVSAEGDYLNVMDRATENVTTYDGSFTAVASGRSLYDFYGFSSNEILKKRLEDETGYNILGEEFLDGYERAYIYSSDAPEQYGIIDMNGTAVIPFEYDDIVLYYPEDGHRIWCNGYFAVIKDGMAGYVTKDGKVTCELKYPVTEPYYDEFDNCGIAGKYKNADGTYTLIAADGTETSGFTNLYDYGNGKFWKATDANNNTYLIDWHGNILFENFRAMDVTEDGAFIIVQQNSDEMPMLYAVDGATVEGTLAADNRISQVQETELPVQEETQVQSEEIVQEEVQVQNEETVQEEPQVQSEDMTQEEVSEQKETEMPSESLSQVDEPKNSAAADLLSSAANLISIDLQANKDAVVILLQQAKAVLETENPDAAMVVNSVITLLSSGTADSGSVTTLITTAQSML